jgi:branched-chain amino acid transport system substrate-binding protein
MPKALVAIVSAVIAGACGDQQPVRIGVIVSAPGVAGAQFAALEINNSQGIRGRPLELRVMSQGGAVTARLALLAADSVSLDPAVIGVVGHSNSSASLSGSQIYNARHLVQIAPTSTAPLLSQAGPYTFRLVASDIHQARYLAGQITADGAKPSIAVFFVNDDYGRSLYHELRARLAASGVPVVFDSPYSEESPLTDVELLAREVAKSRAELLVWLGRPPQLRQLLPVLRRVTPRLPVLASDGVDNPETERNADGVLTGVRFVCFVDMNGSRPALVGMRDRFRAHTGDEATVEAALAYDAVTLLATAAREVGARREAVHGYLRSLGSTRPRFPGVTGDIAFDKNGDLDSSRPSYCLSEVTAQGARVIPSNGGR